MTRDEMRELQRAAEAALAPVQQWHHQCHAASVALVESGAIKGACVARGSCKVVGSQHSWVALGDPYLGTTVIVDPTLWSYTGISPEVYVGSWNKWHHRPRGCMSIYEWGRPAPAKGAVVVLQPPKGGWSAIAKSFLDSLGPLDLEGWQLMANAPVLGWPATEIMKQMSEHPKIKAHIPIDIAGMVLGEVSDIYPRS